MYLYINVSHSIKGHSIFNPAPHFHSTAIKGFKTLPDFPKKLFSQALCQRLGCFYWTGRINDISHSEQFLHPHYPLHYPTPPPPHPIPVSQHSILDHFKLLILMFYLVIASLLLLTNKENIRQPKRKEKQNSK